MKSSQRQPNTKGVKTKRLRKVSANEIQFYITRGAKLHPILYVEFMEMLTYLERREKICLMPSTILQRYSMKWKKTG